MAISISIPDTLMPKISTAAWEVKKYIPELANQSAVPESELFYHRRHASQIICIDKLILPTITLFG